MSDSSIEPSPMHELILPLEAGRIQVFTPIISEEDIFRIIGLEFIPPIERINYGPEKINNKEFIF